LPAHLAQYASLFAEERKAEYGKWSGFYQFDQLTGFPTARAVVAQLLAKLQGMPMIAFCMAAITATSHSHHLSPPRFEDSVCLFALTPCSGQPIPYYQSYNSLYYSFYDYQIPYPNFPLMHENPYVLTWAVRILCASDGCTNTPVGGNYTTPSVWPLFFSQFSLSLSRFVCVIHCHSSYTSVFNLLVSSHAHGGVQANVSMFVPLPGATIRFTTDGTDPSPSSPVYSAPITISANVTSVNVRRYCRLSVFFFSFCTNNL
jgi:hypothetical protein